MADLRPLSWPFGTTQLPGPVRLAADERREMKKRQAVIGWVVYKAAKPFAKRTMKRKAKAAVPARRSGSRFVPNTAAIVAALGAVGGALLFWRKKKSGDDGESSGS
jgi:hypothetical protein